MNKDSIKNEAYKMLTPKRKVHTEGVVETALALADIYGGDKEKVEIASWCHDIFRGVPMDELNACVKEYGLDDKYLNNSNLSHGKLASIYIQKHFGIDDEDIINAISYHTTGRKNMSIVEKILFAADAMEPGRDYPGVKEIRDVVYTDIDKACLLSLEGTVEHLLKSGMTMDEMDQDTMEAIEYFRNKEKCIDDK